MALPPKPVFGTFGAAVFPGAELTFTADAMVRYDTSASVEEIAAYFRRVYEGKRFVIFNEKDDKNVGPCFVVAAGPGYTEADFSAILVMNDPEALRKKKRIVKRQILVTKK